MTIIGVSDNEKLMFTGEKAAQMAAYFTDKEKWRRISVLKLVKLLYLADRESIDRYGEPISHDRIVSMKHGPVLSQTLDLINGRGKENDDSQWDAWIYPRKYNHVSLKKSAKRDHLDQLSDADIEVLSAVWEKFGKMGWWQIRNYTHDHLSEWQKPVGAPNLISEYQVLRALGRSKPEASAIAEDIREQRQLNRVVSEI